MNRAFERIQNFFNNDEEQEDEVENLEDAKPNVNWTQYGYVRIL